MKRAVSLILTAFMGTVALCGVAPAATSRNGVSRVAVGQNSARAATGVSAKRAATTTATASRVSDETTPSVTSRRGARKGTVVGRASDIAGARTAQPTSSDSDKYVTVVVAEGLRNAYNNLTKYLALSDKANKSKLYFKLDSSNKLPSLQTFFGKINNGSNKIAGIYDKNDISTGIQLIDKDGKSIEGRTFTKDATYYMLAAAGGNGGNGGNEDPLIQYLKTTPPYSTSFGNNMEKLNITSNNYVIIKFTDDNICIAFSKSNNDAYTPLGVVSCDLTATDIGTTGQ